MQMNPKFHVVLFAIYALAISVSALLAQSGGAQSGSIQDDVTVDVIRYPLRPFINFDDDVACVLQSFCNEGR